MGRLRWLASMVWLLWSLGGCVVLPDVEAPPVSNPVVSIDDKGTDPPILEPVTIARTAPLSDFSVEQSVTARNLSGALNYAWYYDFDSKSNVPLPFYGLCSDNPRCFFNVCTKPNADKEDSHRLLLVVSDTKLPTDAKTPFDYPEGAVFDSVQWQLNLTGVCP